MVTSMITTIPESVQKTWYVYLLCDPDTEVPFYVGKGTDTRIDQHERFLDAHWDWNEAKKNKIRQIQSQGKQVLKKIVAEFETEQDAFVYEWALITFIMSILRIFDPENLSLKRYMYGQNPSHHCSRRWMLLRYLV